MNWSNNTNGGDDMLHVIKLTCKLGDISEYESLMTGSRKQPKNILEFKNKTTISIDSIDMLETN